MICLPNPLRSAALMRPHHPALVFGGKTWSTRALCRAAAQRAASLAVRGIRPTQRVGICGPPSDGWVTCFHAVGWLGAVAVPLPRRQDARGLDLEAVLDPADLGPPSVRELPERFWPLEEPRLLLRTSGSSGDPSQVTLTTAQLLFSAMGSAIHLGHDTGDRWLACLPLHHIGGAAILLRAAWYGTTVVLLPRFDARQVAGILDSGEVTQVSLVPTMLTRVLDQRPFRPFPPALRMVLLGGSRAPDELVQRCRELSVPVAYTWGMTEAASQVATSAPGSEELRPLPFGRVESLGGTLQIRGPVVPDQGLCTRDRGAVDSGGRVRVLGRTDDVIISGGEKVDPTRVERALLRHPAVADAAVRGEADREWGERVVAILVARGQRPNDAEIHAWCREHLEAHERPRHFWWRDALPRDAMGKLPRSALDPRGSLPPDRQADEPSRQGA